MKGGLRQGGLEHQAFAAARRFLDARGGRAPEGFAAFVDSWRFQDGVDGSPELRWDVPRPGRCRPPGAGPRLFVRGDSPRFAARQAEQGLAGAGDRVQEENAAWFDALVAEAAAQAGLLAPGPEAAGGSARHLAEAAFHDRWAEAEDPDRIDVRASAEACTSPELRYIRGRLGELGGKRLLDVGCGLGEAGVYFALEGALVTATDLSAGMLAATAALAQRHGVPVRTHLAAAERLGLDATERFDVIYLGNLFHHVEIERTIATLRPHLAPGGLLVSWDPVRYNPVINLYRRMATEVRTADEHPLGLSDIALFRKHFRSVETRYFWLTTLVIFVAMGLLQRRDPNQVRYWKKVVEEADRWAWIYRPLEKVDRVLLRLFPFLGLLCWNVVVVARNPREEP